MMRIALIFSFCLLGTCLLAEDPTQNTYEEFPLESALDDESEMIPVADDLEMIPVADDLEMIPVADDLEMSPVADDLEMIPVANDLEMIPAASMDDSMNCCSAPVYADACCAARHSLFVGANVAYARFQPHNAPYYNGCLSGAQVLYEYRCNILYEALRFKWMQGSTSSPCSNRYIIDYDTQGRIGFTMQICQRSLTAFTGFGWRYVSHELKQPNAADLNFYYNEVYIPVGLSFVYFDDDEFSAALNFTWMPQVFPNVNIEPIGGARWILKRTMNNYLIELPLAYTWCKRWSANLKPFFEYWQDGESIASTGSLSLALPKNTYRVLGIELNIGFVF